jgi:hypothetical protein
LSFTITPSVVLFVFFDYHYCVFNKN